MPLRVLVPASTLLLAASQLAAQADPCTDRVVSHGNNVTGRTLAVSRDYPGVTASTLFETLRSALEAAPGQLGPVQISESDAARGVIRGSFKPPAAARPIALEVTVAALPNGDAQASFTNRLPAAMFVSSREWATVSCSFLAELAVPADGARRAVAGRESATRPSTATAIPEVRASTAGLAYFEVVAGTLTQPEEIDRFRIRAAASGDTVRVWSHDPRQQAPDGFRGWHHPTLKPSVRDLGAGRTLPEQPGGQVILSGTGPFEVRVESEAAASAYHLIVTKTSNRPEQIAARISTTDTIRGEAIDYPRDTDEFLFTGRAGEEIQVYVGGHPSLIYRVLRRRAGARDEQIRGGSAGIISLPADGTYVLAVEVAFLGTESNTTGPYWFRLRRRD